MIVNQATSLGVGFAVAALAYFVLTGSDPAPTWMELQLVLREQDGLDPRRAVDGIPDQVAELVVEATRFAAATRSDSAGAWVQLLLEAATAPDEPAVEAWGRHWIDQGLRAMEALLARPERPQARFCYGDAPGIADIALASHCAGAGYFDCPLDPYAGVRAILERCMAMPAFSETHPLAIKAAAGGSGP